MSVRNDINVTPLVDVMLVLLIIFMLMTLVTGRGHDVPLPVASQFTLEKDQRQPVVAIDLAGNLWVDKDKLGPVTVASLGEMDAKVQGPARPGSTSRPTTASITPRSTRCSST